MSISKDAKELGIPSSPEALEELRSKSENWTPLMKAYNELAQNEEKMNAAIILQMQKMIQKGMIPDWGTFSATKMWVIMSMNLTQENRKKYEARWSFLYQQLMETEDGSKDTGNGSEEPVPAASDGSGGGQTATEDNSSSDSEGLSGSESDLGSTPGETDDSGV